MPYLLTRDMRQVPWNKGRATGQKPPLKRNDIWVIRVHLQLEDRVRDLALLNLAIDSKLRACDLVRLRVRDVTQSNQAVSRVIILQRKTGANDRFRRVSFLCHDPEHLSSPRQLWFDMRHAIALIEK